MLNEEKHIRWLLFLIGFGAFVLLMGLEVITEEESLSFGDLAVDGLNTLLTITASVGVALLFQRMQVQHEEKISLIRDLELAREEGNDWRMKAQSYVAGLKAEITRQFLDWSLTSAEQEIGMLILKGLTHKEIATLRTTSDATVRQQAQSIYRKANLPGKTAFCAYFLDDLFDPGNSFPDCDNEMTN